MLHFSFNMPCLQDINLNITLNYLDFQWAKIEKHGYNLYDIHKLYTLMIYSTKPRVDGEKWCRFCIQRWIYTPKQL